MQNPNSTAIRIGNCALVFLALAWLTGCAWFRGPSLIRLDRLAAYHAGAQAGSIRGGAIESDVGVPQYRTSSTYIAELFGFDILREMVQRQAAVPEYRVTNHAQWWVSPQYNDLVIWIYRHDRIDDAYYFVYFLNGDRLVSSMWFIGDTSILPPH